MKLSKLLYQLVLVIFSGSVFMACDDDANNPNPPNEEEVITTVILTFSSTGNPDIVATWRDTDGPGGNDPVIDDIILANGVNYDLSVEFLNESDPLDVEDITEEIREENDEHQVFYTGTAVGTAVDYTYGDIDDNMNPVGLEGTVNTLAVNTGEFTVTLKHQPGIKDNTTGINDGDTDVEADFDLEVQ